MDELFPVVSGVVLGIVVAGLRLSLRLWAGVLLSVGLGMAATLVSGELRGRLGVPAHRHSAVAVSAGVSFTLARAAFLRLPHSW